MVGVSRIQGRTVGVVGNNPLDKTGYLNINAFVKAARFVRFCESWNIPILTFVAVLGFYPEQIKSTIEYLFKDPNFCMLTLKLLCQRLQLLQEKPRNI